MPATLKDITEIRINIERALAEKKALQESIEAKTAKGDTAGVEQDQKELTKCKHYLQRLKHIADGYIKESDPKVAYTKISKERFQERPRQK